ncbi:MAG: T9SS type A sorting domain-containing protein [Bacteroidia bacterium]
MKRKITITISALVILAGATFTASIMKSGDSYQPRVKTEATPDGHYAYINSMRNNQVTGTIDPQDIANAREQIALMRQNKTKAEWPLNWEFAGPDNIAGKVMAILIDRNDPDILYAGASGGTVFKSINKGASWYPMPMDNDGFGITGLAQTPDGTIYAGTGDSWVQTSGLGAEGSKFITTGVFKSTDGETFELLPSSLSSPAIGHITNMVAHPTQNIVFVASQTGLKYSDDGGASWKTARAGSAGDVAINKNGVVLVNIGTTLWRSTDPTNAGSYSIVSGVAYGGSQGRMKIAWSESDPDYAYVVTGGVVGTYSSALSGLWKSTNAGASFDEVVDQTSTYFYPFRQGSFSSAWHNCTIGVHPRDKDRVFIGGIGFAEWTLAKGPEMVGNNGNGPTNPFGIHADKHVIVFDNTGEDPIMYVGSDGGVSRTTNEDLDRYADRITNLTSIQGYAISANPRGEVMGGTQDNSNILVSTESYPRLFGEDMIRNRIAGVTGSLGGDGFENAMSHYNQDIMFVQQQRANLFRTTDAGKSAGSLLWDNRVGAVIQGEVYAAGNGGGFAYGLHLWENPEAVEGKLLNGPSDYYDSIYQARLFLTLDDGVWLCNNATSSLFNAENPSNDNVRWFKVANTSGKVLHYATTRDGNSLFAATNNGRLYRIDGINKANWDTTELVSATAISDSITRTDIASGINIFGRHISSVSVDATDDNRVMITLGNYGNTRYIYMTENALDPSPTWTNITSNLPRIPVYSGIISQDDPSVLILGTEFGFYATNNGYSSTPNWIEANTGIDGANIPTSPVFDITQAAEKPWTGAKIYAITHGMGMWKTSSMLTNVKENKTEIVKAEITAYPNPANNYCNFNTSVKGEYTLNVYNINGELVDQYSGRSNGKIELNTSELLNGNYFVEIVGSDNKAVTKIIIQH